MELYALQTPRQSNRQIRMCQYIFFASRFEFTKNSPKSVKP